MHKLISIAHFPRIGLREIGKSEGVGAEDRTERLYPLDCRSHEDDL